MSNFYPYWEWEDYANGFYRRISSNDFPALLKQAIDTMRRVDEWGRWMATVVDAWPVAAEHNLIAMPGPGRSWTGQAALCHWKGIPAMVTKTAWWELSIEYQDRANGHADDVIQDFINRKGAQRLLWQE